MIEYIIGDIFDSPAQVIVNTVNTVGVMGKGLALSFKQRYPEMFVAYRNACERHQFAIGKLMLWYAPDHWVLMFPTKENWRYSSKLEYIEKGLFKFCESYAEKNISSIAFPRLGCGNGDLNWDDVKPLMEKYLKQLPIDVYIYLGLDSEAVPEQASPQKTIEWMRSHAKDMSFNGVKEDIIYMCSMVPFSFSALGAPVLVNWEDNGLRFSDENANDVGFLAENAFFDLWDEIRSKGVFPSPQKEPVKILALAMLHALGYLSAIRIQDKKTLEMSAGYQINEGAGRIFTLHEESL